jgi:hypothetical protein
VARIAAFILAAAFGAAAFTLESTAATKSAGAFPRQLVGTWTRMVKKADIAGAHVPPSEAGEVYPGLDLMLVVGEDGAASLKTAGPQGGGRWTGRLARIGTDRLRITIPFDFPNVYRWRVSGRLLSLAKISDSDRIGARPAWFTGVWKRR